LINTNHKHLPPNTGNPLKCCKARGRDQLHVYSISFVAFNFVVKIIPQID